MTRPAIEVEYDLPRPPCPGVTRYVYLSDYRCEGDVRIAVIRSTPEGGCVVHWDFPSPFTAPVPFPSLTAATAYIDTQAAHYGSWVDSVI